MVDKPAGPTSHDIVALARRVLRVDRIGHTGTLDPLATGVLPLAIGRATRLVRFLGAGWKEYLAWVRFGIETDTYDSSGRPAGEPAAPPALEALQTALARFEGVISQTPPPFSAKKIGGRRLYSLARRGEPVMPAPVDVTIDRLALEQYADGLAQLRVVCSPGTYVRSLAHDLGRAADSRAHLEALRRIRSGDFTVDEAVAPERLEDAVAVARAFHPLDHLLAAWPTARLTDSGVRRAAHGNRVGPEHLQQEGLLPSGPVRLLDGEGRLIAVAEPAGGGTWHPTVVLVDPA